MEILIIGDNMAVYQRQGNDRNGNPIYIINIFEACGDERYYNVNYKTKKKLDKYGNIKIQSYNISGTINQIIQSI